MNKEYVIYIYIYTHTHIYNGILLSHKEERDNSICSIMDEPGDYHTKLSKSDRDKFVI